jgi:hypothetical protein
MNSAMTRYGVIGTSADPSVAAHSASQAARTRSSSAFTLSRPAGRPPWLLIASMNCRSTRRASPSKGWSAT